MRHGLTHAATAAAAASVLAFAPSVGQHAGTSVSEIGTDGALDEGTADVATAGGSVQLSVTTPGMATAGVEHATFDVSGACLTSDGAVRVTERVCDEASSSSRGQLALARLGFRAARQVDAGQDDRSLLEVRTAAAPEQLVVVHLEVLDPGDVSVEVSGHATDDVDPKVVSGTASDDGREHDRAVVWELNDAEPGAHEFSARFAPNATTGFVGSFVPEVTISRQDTSTDLLEFVGGSVPAAGLVERRHTLLMEQRVTDAYGEPPAVAAFGYEQAGSLATPTSFSTYGTLDAQGNYHAPSAGPVSHVVESPFADIAPGATGHITAVVRSRSFPNRLGMEKADVVGSPTTWEGEPFTPEASINGLAMGLATAAPGEGTLTSPNSPWAGMLYDGDSVHYGLPVGIGGTGGGHDGLPSRVGGALGTDWDGTLALAWSATWANAAPGLEPNTLGPDPSWTDGGSDVRYLASAVVPLVVTGGDIDNRDGDEPIVGDSIVVEVPSGLVMTGSSMITFGASESPTNYSWEYATDPAAGTRTITPSVGPGGYWLQSTIDGYDRRWSPHAHFVSIGARDPAHTSAQDGVVLHHDVIVSPGEQATVEAFDAAGVRFAHRQLTPGAWQVQIDLDTEQVQVRRTRG